MDIKFFYNEIKIDGGKLVKCGFYEYSGPAYPAGTITMHADSYCSSLPCIGSAIPENNTDSQCDHFEKDRLYITPDNKYFQEAKTACAKGVEHWKKVSEKRNSKHPRLHRAS